MKLISMCVLLLAVFAWSNIFSIDAGISFEKGYLDIDTTKTCNVDTSYINCSLEKVWRITRHWILLSQCSLCLVLHKLLSMPCNRIRIRVP